MEDNKSKADQAMKLIEQAVQLIGWNIIIPTAEELHYVVLCNPDVEDKIIEKLDME
jgi:hypothetical protein